jgi:hypothetical protein
MPDLLGALRAEVRAIVRDEIKALSKPRLARIADVGLTPKQIPTLEREGVVFEKVGKYWCVDLATFDAYRARRRAERPAPANDSCEPDPLEGVDPAIADAIRAAAGVR